ncbi:ATP-NAD kinase-like domain-containing protein [Podospora appendiculata]|uniref:ATP-NAD kinase-like domain-containing protein n=1 Tax=Podospora appendiculata TaxID=314037 RepID=A0AAE0X599_9PEZI|nr:ATP-NAD kinase-like domain-containing protein [Podospora appendiculata]
MSRTSFLARYSRFVPVLSPTAALNMDIMVGSLGHRVLANSTGSRRRCFCAFGNMGRNLVVAGRGRGTRSFSATCRRREILDISTLPDRLVPLYHQTDASSLLSLHWPRPPCNILLMPKSHAPRVTVSAVEFAKHIHSNYPGLNLVFESHVAKTIHDALPFPIYTTDPSSSTFHFARKIDLVTTLGGDGTILRAASLFSMENILPPILSFSMGSLGFLGEWKFEEYKRAWRECYMSGSAVTVEDLVGPHTQAGKPSRRRHKHDDSGRSSAAVSPGWESVRGNGKSMGLQRTSKILLRSRLRVGIYDSEGRNINEHLMPSSTGEPDHGAPFSLDDTTHPSFPRSPVWTESPPALHAINEVSIDRGVHPHLAIIDIYVNDHFLTEAVADGILISTPTGSTAYSLSAGGSIVHPLVKSLLITPISPRSLSFRPLVLPLETKVVLKLSKRNRGRELPVSIDGKRRVGVGIGMEVRVEGESLEKGPDGWRGGVPCVIRASSKSDGDGKAGDDDSWVGGLNGLLKFNYPFGESGEMH